MPATKLLQTAVTGSRRKSAGSVGVQKGETKIIVGSSCGHKRICSCCHDVWFLAHLHSSTAFISAGLRNHRLPLLRNTTAQFLGMKKNLRVDVFTASCCTGVGAKAICYFTQGF